MSFFLNLFRGGSKEDPKHDPILVKDGKTYYSVKVLGKCCLDLKVSLPAADIIAILRIVWSRRMSGPFSDIAVGLFESSSLKNVRDIEVILFPSTWQNTKGKVITEDLGSALSNLMTSTDTDEYVLPKVQLKRMMHLPKPTNPGTTITEPFQLTLFSGSYSYSSSHAAKEHFFETECKSQETWGDVKYLCSQSIDPGDDYGSSPYLVGLNGKSTERVWDLLVLFAARCRSDPCVKKVNVMPLKDHLSKDNYDFPKIILELAIETPLPYFVESLHLLLTKSEFAEILDSQLCTEQSPGWATVGMCHAYPGGLTSGKPLGECIFTISSSSSGRKWGPNGAFLMANVLGSTNIGINNPFWNGKEVKGKKLSDLLIAIDDGDSYRIDYGWSPRYPRNTKRFVLHPHFLEYYVSKLTSLGVTFDRTKPYVENIFQVVKENGAFLFQDFGTAVTTKESYEAILSRYGFIEGSLVKIDYEA